MLSRMNEDHDDTTEFELETDDETTPEPNAEPALPQGFVPPARASRARIRRFNLESGAWEDAPVILDGSTTSIVPVENASPNLPLAEPVATAYRMTWQDSKGQTLGYSRTWRIRESKGGESNTPRMWPVGVPQRHHVTAPSRSSLTPDETVKLMAGLSHVVHEAARPLIMQIEAFHEGALAREREFHDRQRAVDAANFERTIARDREFLAAMRDVHERPRDQKIALLESQLTQLREDDAAAEEEAAQQAQQNGWNLAGKVIENAPELIRTVADEVRRGGERATQATEKGGSDD